MRFIAPHILLLIGLFLPLPGAWAQSPSDSSSTPAWTLIADGEEVAWPLEASYPADSLAVVARKILHLFQREGFYYAEIDSATIDTTQTPLAAALFATRGEAVALGELAITGATALDSLALLRLMDTRPGRPLDAERLETDIDALLQQYEAAGLPLARIRIDNVEQMAQAPSQLRLTLDVYEGRTLTLERVQLHGAERTKVPYAMRVAGLRNGQSLTGYDPVEIQRRLEATGFFRSVDVPELLIRADTAATIRIPVVEEAPGAFDLVLGYVPSQGTGTMQGGLVGNGHLTLRNLFGGGRVLALKLNRLPGSISSVDVRAADPFIAGFPFRLETRFAGIQQDSTYGQQRYAVEAGYRFGQDVEIFSTLSREQTKPGQAGLRLIGGRQRIARSTGLFYGLGMRFERLDRLYNPRRGLLAETNVERGRKERTTRRTIEADSLITETTFLRQERLRATLRGYLPTFARQVLVLGGEAQVLLSNEYDASDLYRFGGATSLRGYNEEQFLGRAVGRVFTEYRYQLDRTSYAFVFFDLGYEERPAIEDQPSQRGFHPGYGLGAQVGTDLGLITFTLASNPEDPDGVRVHLGLSIGL